jgi:hypothetical protein
MRRRRVRFAAQRDDAFGDERSHRSTAACKQRERDAERNPCGSVRRWPMEQQSRLQRGLVLLLAGAAESRPALLGASLSVLLPVPSILADGWRVRMCKGLWSWCHGPYNRVG